jgi:CRISPR-associated protein Csx17
MSYLKALGVFRLVAEDKEHGDPSARGCWRCGAFVLETKLDPNGLAKFFLEQYKPTPILAPWNGGSGFFDETTTESPLSLLRTSSNPRLEEFREAITSSDLVVNALVAARHAWKRLEQQKKELEKQRTAVPDQLKEQISAAKREHDTRKNRLQLDLRQTWPDRLLDWFDAVAVFGQEGEAAYQPLLGSGGNDGRLDYTKNFMERLANVIPLSGGEPPTGAAGWLASALFVDSLAPLRDAAVGQFNPGGIGGANGVQGNFEANSRVNPWDFVLMIEGALLFAGSVARRLGSNAGDRAVFPFTVSTVAVGYGSATASEETTDGSRAEMWLPLWDEPAGFAEVRQLFAEGRAQVNRRQAKDSVEFALAVNLLGVSRGVTAFTRYGFLKRNGLAFLAAPLGRVAVTPRPSGRLLDDPPLRVWIDRLRGACRDKDKTPARYQTALWDIDRAIFAFATRSQLDAAGERAALLPVLRAVGRAERTLAGGLAFCKDKYIRPLQGLSADWPDQAHDGSAEFALAASLAGVGSSDEVGPLRAHLEEVEAKGDYVTWSPGSTSAVWSNRALADNLAAVFRRRQMEAFRAGGSGVPLRSKSVAPVGAVLAFLRGDLDDEKLHDLVWGLTGIDWRAVERRVPERPEPDPEIPTEFGLPRLLVNPLSLVPNGSHWCCSEGESEHATKHDPDVFHALAAGRGDAVDRAARRLRSGGLTAAGHRNRQTALRSLAVVSPHLRPGHSARLLASMLFPLSNRDLGRVADAVLYPPEPQE